MTFLQPWLLWGLPLLLVPVLIHLFNRLRHRSLPWAAMMFLRSATRKSTRYARLRQFLVLLFRVLAVLGLILFLSRPLAGGWAGWMFSSAPEVIMLLLDRSASMEDKEGDVTKRQQAVRLLSQAASKYAERSRFVLVESATRAPLEIESVSILPDLPNAAPTDTAADMPAMLQQALDWLIQNKPGSAEIWIASDLQESNWDSRSDRWSGLAAGFKALPQRVRVRMLGLNSEPALNHSVALAEVRRRGSVERSDLELAIDIERTAGSPATLPLLINVDGASIQVELRMEGSTLRFRHRLPLASKTAEGWGYVELPSDANARDNRSYFTYAGPAVVRAAVIGGESANARLLQAAAAPDSKNTNQLCDILAPAAVETANLEQYSLLLWQAPLPQGVAANRIRAFIEAGGTVLFFAPGEPGQFGDLGWAGVKDAAADKPFRLRHWEEREGPLAKTEEGWSLPMTELEIFKRQTISGDATVLASFDDGAPFLTRRTLGRGQIFFCATHPGKEWSTLSEGVVLVPMVQRLMDAGARRFATGAFVECGEWQPRESQRWMPVDSTASKDIHTQSGVYRLGSQFVAVNRPAREDARELVEPAKAKALLGQIPMYLLEEKQGGGSHAESELWRLFLVVMALCLLVEAILILPEKRETVATSFDAPAREREERPVELVT